MRLIVMKNTQKRDRALLEELNKNNRELKAIIEEQNALIFSLGQQLETVKSSQYTILMSYIAMTVSDNERPQLTSRNRKKNLNTQI